VRLVLTLELRRALAERLSEQAIRSGKDLEAAVIDMLEAGGEAIGGATLSERGHCRRLSPPLSCRSMGGLLDDLNAFFQEHRRCGEMESGVDEGRVWMACDGCGAVLSRLVLGTDRLPPNWEVS